ncbi:MAG: GNAT family N-acetyltransferase [Gemmatimonadota bacterium]|nr:GNAT family N-acetyltransferase [Gemmatimonadota bacterium]
MHVQILEESPEQLADYARVPIAFLVREVFDGAAIERLRCGQDAAPTPIAAPYQKDYDAYADHHPTAWAVRFDIAAWVVLAAYVQHRRVGGAVLVVNDSQLDLLREPAAHALLWDLRVAPDERRRGVGAALLHAAERRAVDRGASQLRVETQQINVPACRFYLRYGFSLESVRPDAYPDLPEEVQLLWRKSLASGSRRSG